MHCEDIEEYIEQHIDPEPEWLHALYRQTQLKMLYPRMCSGHLQGRVLKMLVRMIRPQRILELGTYTGYTAQCMAEGVEPGAEVHTVEINEEAEDFIRKHMECCPYADRIHLHIGDASEVLPTLADSPFDLVFIDANKRDYSRYYELVMPNVRQGGFIIADNTLWDGHVVDTARHHDEQSLAIATFNDLVAADTRVEKVILPLRDGLTLIYKK